MNGTDNKTAFTETNPHTETMRARVAELRAMRDTIPYFKIPTQGATARMASSARVPADFVELTLSMIDHDLSLQAKATSAEVHDRLNFAEAYGTLADEFDLMAQSLRHSIVAARSEVGSIALNVYTVTKRDAKRSKDGELTRKVADLSRALGVRARLAKAKAAAAEQKAAVEKARAEGATLVQTSVAPKL
jgi:hypothetical protein